MSTNIIQIRHILKSELSLAYLAEFDPEEAKCKAMECFQKHFSNHASFSQEEIDKSKHRKLSFPKMKPWVNERFAASYLILP